MDEPEDLTKPGVPHADHSSATSDLDLQLLDSIEEELDDVERRLGALDEGR